MYVCTSGQMSYGVISASAQGGFWIIVSAESAGGGEGVARKPSRENRGGPFFNFFIKFFYFLRFRSRRTYAMG